MQGGKVVSDVTDAALKMALMTPGYQGQQLEEKHAMKDEICASMLNANHGNVSEHSQANNMSFTIDVLKSPSQAYPGEISSNQLSHSQQENHDNSPESRQGGMLD